MAPSTQPTSRVPLAARTRRMRSESEIYPFAAETRSTAAVLTGLQRALYSLALPSSTFRSLGAPFSATDVSGVPEVALPEAEAASP